MPADDPIRAAREATAVIYRVQDAHGRGPYRPGMSNRWADPFGIDHPPFFIEFGVDCLRDVPAGWHAGCGFASLREMAAWFSPAECGRLERLHYHPVVLRDCRVIRQSARQTVFARQRPFRQGAVFCAWPHIDRDVMIE